MGFAGVDVVPAVEVGRGADLVGGVAAVGAGAGAGAAGDAVGAGAGAGGTAVV